MSNASRIIPLILKHEGGFVDHPDDPGGATNRGVTIGTLKRLKIDVDGDGDSDIADLRKLPESEAVRVYKLFYWDKVSADILPIGLDYAVADFAVNSGPSRAAKYLQRIVGVKDDGDIGPKTIAAVAGSPDIKHVINKLCDRRLSFMKRIQGGRLWKTFGRGWQRRVDDVRAHALELAGKAPQQPLDHVPAPPAQEVPRVGLFAALLGIIRGRS